MTEEFGVDLGVAVVKPSGGSSIFEFGTPVDGRVGFVSKGKLMFEPRCTLAYASSSGSSAYDFDLGLNLLYGMGEGGNHSGPYLTVGGSVDLEKIVTSETFIAFNGGVGTRMGYGSGAIRLEAFVMDHLKKSSIGFPNTLTIGARVGLSLWH